MVKESKEMGRGKWVARMGALKIRLQQNKSSSVSKNKSVIMVRKKLIEIFEVGQRNRERIAFCFY
jgi:hypothetical protein